jgi:Kef-type K+ transport system membrane component KefB
MFLVAWLSATRKREVYHEDPELHETHLPRERQVSGPFFFVAMGSLVVKSKQMIYLMWVKQETPTHLGMVYTIYLYLFMVILGMVYSCFTHIIPIGHVHIIAMRVSWGPRQSVLRRSESMRSQGGPGR